MMQPKSYNGNVMANLFIRHGQPDIKFYENHHHALHSYSTEWLSFEQFFSKVPTGGYAILSLKIQTANIFKQYIRTSHIHTTCKTRTISVYNFKALL